jgi:hypothetical protein
MVTTPFLNEMLQQLMHGRFAAAASAAAAEVVVALLCPKSSLQRIRMVMMKFKHTETQYIF